MDRLPDLSPGVSFAPAPCGAVVHDALRHEVHLVNPAGLVVLDACRAGLSFDETVDVIADAGGLDRPVVADAVRDVAASFVQREIVGREAGPTPGMWAEAPSTPLEPGEHATIQVAGEHRIRFRSFDAELIDAVRARLLLDAAVIGDRSIDGSSTDVLDGHESADAEPTDDFHLTVTESGGVTLLAETTWEFASRGALLDQLVFVVTDYVARSTRVTTIHAGAARSPDGQTVLFPAESGAGKSTLVAALLQDGWDYLTDESVGVHAGPLRVVPFPKPLRLGTSSRAALGIDVPLRGGDDLAPHAVIDDVRLVTEPQPVTSIISPAYVAGAPAAVDGPLTFEDALGLLVSSSQNLRIMGDAGVAALCALATDVPIYRIRYGTSDDAHTLIDGLLEATSSPVEVN